MNSYNYRNLNLVLRTATLGFLVLGVALPKSSLAAVLEEVIVTAQKREQNLQEIPVAVTALSGEQLSSQTITDVFDLQQSVPSLTVRQNQTATTSNFSIRGVGTSGSNFGLESSVGLYVDGVYRARQNSMINELVDIEAVEVLRGPQGTLFGRNTPSGAVILRTVKPEHDFGGYLDLDAGNFNLLSLNGAVGGSLVEDRLAYRLTGFSTSRDGYVEDLVHGDNVLNDRDRFGGRFQLLYTPNDDISARVIVDYSEIDENCCAAVTVKNNYFVYARDSYSGEFSTIPSAGTDTILSIPSSVMIPGTPIPGFGATVLDESRVFDDVTAFDTLPRSTNEDSGISAEISFPAMGGEITSITGIRQFESSDRADGDFTSAAIFSRTEEAEQDVFSQEFRFNLSDDKYNLTLGAYYFDQSLDTASNTMLGSQANNFISLSVFSQAQALADQAALAANSGDFVTAAALADEAQSVGLTATTIYAGLENVTLPTTHPLYPLQLLGYQGVGFPDELTARNLMSQDHQAWAVYGQWDYFMTPETMLTLGMRYTDEEKSLNGTFTEPNASWGNLLGLPELTLINGRPNINESLNDNQITGTIKLSWMPSDDWLFYTSYATGYKSGGTNTDRINPSFSVLFDAETSEAFELGMKADFPDENLRVNLTLHHTTTKDYQTNAFQGIGFNLSNAGKVVAKGMELELWWNPLDNLSVTGAYVYNKAEFKDFNRANCWIGYSWLTGVQDPGRVSPTDSFCDRSGDPLDTNPEHTFMIGATQVIPINDSLEAYFHGDYNYRSAQFMDGNLDPYKEIDGYGLLNMRSGIRFLNQDMEVALWARNLLDEDYLMVNFDVPLQSGKLNAYPTEPRTFGISLTKQF